MRGRIRKLEDGTFTVVYYKECAEDADAVVPVSCKLMPNYGHFRDGDSIEFELIEFAQEDGSFSSYAKPSLTINPHISQIVNKNYEVITGDKEDMTLREKLNDSIITNINIVESENRMYYEYNHLELAEQCEVIADEFAIGFLKFANKNYIYRKGHYHMKGDFEKSININQQQLLEIYKKEKGL